MFGGIEVKNILLIHGWDYDNYYGRINTNAWENRKIFINALSKKNNAYYMDLPGFGLRKEPKENAWNLTDYAKFINDYIKTNNLKIDYLLGYSFGGAVAVEYKKIYDNDIKLILVSPALIRNNDKSKKFIKTPKCLDFIRQPIRNYYLINIVKNKEMLYGTKFLRNTYQNIVRENMLPVLSTFNPKDIIIIYGELDNMVNPNKVMATVSKELKSQIMVIKGGSHNIAVTHTKELTEVINSFINSKS